MAKNDTEPTAGKPEYKADSIQVLKGLEAVRKRPGMGDQESDLSGGYAERTFKLPNPVYYLP